MNKIQQHKINIYEWLDYNFNKLSDIDRFFRDYFKYYPEEILVTIGGQDLNYEQELARENLQDAKDSYLEGDLFACKFYLIKLKELIDA